LSRAEYTNVVRSKIRPLRCTQSQLRIDGDMNAEIGTDLDAMISNSTS
jgi:hypothetical protein